MADTAKTCAAELMPLGRVPGGSRVVVSRLDGGQCMALRHSEMGVLPGVPLLIEIRGGRLALSRGMAEQILVQWRRFYFL